MCLEMSKLDIAFNSNGMLRMRGSGEEVQDEGGQTGKKTLYYHLPGHCYTTLFI